jgi:type IV pilus assembly protein PilA
MLAPLKRYVRCMPKVSKLRTFGRPSRSCGFTLLELSLVVGVILVIAAIAIPSMLRARMKANEASAVASLRTIDAAEAMYTASYPDVGYSGSLANLGAHGSTCETPGKTNSCLIMDSLLTSGVKSGYTFDLVGDGKVPDRAYTVTATPMSIGVTGRCTFGTDQMAAFRILGSTGGGRYSESTNLGCGQS